MQKSDRIRMIQEIADFLSPQSWVDIDLILDSFGANTLDTWSGDERSYILEMLRHSSDRIVKDIATHCQIHTGIDEILEETLFWDKDYFRLFVSHLSRHERFVGDVEGELRKFGIQGFVAHASITPTREWQTEIERALATCESLAAFLHPGFNESAFTDHEVGWALGRGIPIIPLCMEKESTTPYGLMSKIQGVRGWSLEKQEIAKNIFDLLVSNEDSEQRVKTGLIRAWADAQSWGDANRCAILVENHVDEWTEDRKNLLRLVRENPEAMNESTYSSREIFERLEAESNLKEDAPPFPDDIPF